MPGNVLGLTPSRCLHRCAERSRYSHAVISVPTEGELLMRRSFRALIATGLCLAIAATASAAFAGPGDLDKTFSGDGFKVVDYAGGTDIFYGVAAHGNAPTTCGVGSNEATLTSFTAGGGFNKNFSGDGTWRQDVLGHGYSYLEACRFLKDGRLVAVGAAAGADGNDRMIVVVRRPNGKPDTSFSGDGLAVFRFAGIADSDAYDLAVQPDGKIVVAGEGYDGSTTPAKGFFEVARLRANGALDKTFSNDGLAKINFGPNDEGAWKVQLLHDGTIVLAGWIKNNAGTEYNTAVAELKPNGALDRSFSSDGMATYNFLKANDDYALGMDIGSGGAIVLGLYRYDGSYRAAIAELKPGGKPAGRDVRHARCRRPERDHGLPVRYRARCEGADRRRGRLRQRRTGTARARVVIDRHRPRGGTRRAGVPASRAARGRAGTAARSSSPARCAPCARNSACRAGGTSGAGTTPGTP